MTDPTIYGVSATEFQAQPNFRANQNEVGGWTATQSFICREGALSDDAFRNKFGKGASPTSLDTSLDTYWNTLGLSRVAWALRPGGLAEITVFYAGFAASGTGGPTASVPIYELDVQEGRLTIMEHPDVIGLADEDRAYLDKVWQYRITYDGTNWLDEWGFKEAAPTAGDTTTFAKLIAGGRRYFDLKTLIWTKRWSDDTGFTNAEVANIGEIESPEGSPPTPAGTRDWIVSDVFQSQEGDLFRKRKSWTMSVEGGWETSLYTI